MLKKRKWNTLLILLAIGFQIGVVGIIIWSIGVKVDGVIVGKYVNEYDEYYLYKMKYNPKPFTLINVPGMGTEYRYKIWFLPGKKRKMLKKIKEEIVIELENLIANNNDIFKDYEISDDFTRIYVYCYRDARYIEREKPTSRIEDLKYSDASLKLVFYNELVHGYGSLYFGDTISVIEDE